MVRKSKIVKQLRRMGMDEQADRAEEILPDKVDPEKHEGVLRSLGLGNLYSAGPMGGSGGYGGGFGGA
jgi:hypothetical protein